MKTNKLSSKIIATFTSVFLLFSLIASVPFIGVSAETQEFTETIIDFSEQTDTKYWDQNYQVVYSNPYSEYTVSYEADTYSENSETSMHIVSTARSAWSYQMWRIPGIPSNAKNITFYVKNNSSSAVKVRLFAFINDSITNVNRKDLVKAGVNLENGITIESDMGITVNQSDGWTKIVLPLTSDVIHANSYSYISSGGAFYFALRFNNSAAFDVNIDDIQLVSEKTVGVTLDKTQYASKDEITASYVSAEAGSTLTVMKDDSAISAPIQISGDGSTVVTAPAFAGNYVLRYSNALGETLGDVPFTVVYHKSTTTKSLQDFESTYSGELKSTSGEWTKEIVTTYYNTGEKSLHVIPGSSGRLVFDTTFPAATCGVKFWIKTGDNKLNLDFVTYRADWIKQNSYEIPANSEQIISVPFISEISSGWGYAGLQFSSDMVGVEFWIDSLEFVVKTDANISTDKLAYASGNDINVTYTYNDSAEAKIAVYSADDTALETAKSEILIGEEASATGQLTISAPEEEGNYNLCYYNSEGKILDISTFAVIVRSENIIEDFETVDTTFLRNTGAGTTKALDTTETHSGTYSLAVGGKSTDSYQNIAWAASVPTNAKAISFWVKNTGDQAIAFKMNMKAQNYYGDDMWYHMWQLKSSAGNDLSESIPNDGEWHKISFDIYSNSTLTQELSQNYKNEISNVYIALRASSWGDGSTTTFNLDDIEFETLDYTPSINTDKEEYEPNEAITVNYNGRLSEIDCIRIGDTLIYLNDSAAESGSIQTQIAVPGLYTVKFYRNAYEVLAEKDITVRVNINQTDVAGDINGDGVLDIRDLVHFKKYLANIYCGINDKAADLNNDGEIKADDLVLLRKLLLGISLS